eukprot:TRINITY_DN11189_c0_g1_i2.p1 TRINITY_DN11189_c0_g1~~TRINITY_DN11189_c0_g1_i2.p1  ORF type:complete len:374 (+),score=61.78 TRINITY_DN11189_c0_g1_i2:27-1124(+)
MTASHCFSWGLALVSITAYSFNSQVFVWIGSADFGGKLFELFLFHVPASLFLLYFVCRRQDAREALEERGQSSLLYFALQVLIGACFQMGIYYLWFRASLLIPTQLLAAVFQTSIVLVYVLSVVFLGERFSCLKVAWISLAVAGVILATFGSEWFGKSGKKTSFPTGAPLLQGVLLALGAEVCKALYQVWFKRSFGEPSTRFALLFGGLVGLAHVFPVLPGVALLNAAHVHDARMTISDWSAGQGCLILLAACIAGAVNVGSLAVIALRSPVFWSSIQLLAVPISVLFDFFIRGIVPGIFNCAGYLLIIVACLLLSTGSTKNASGDGTSDVESGKSPADATKRKVVSPSLVGISQQLEGNEDWMV